MMRSRSSRWLSGVGVAVLIGGLTLANYGGGVTPAQAHDHQKNPFKQILGKLNEISEMLMKLSNGGGGGGAGSVAENYTMRWDTNNLTSRFTPAFPGAMLDKNTGLVWEQAPAGTNTWTGARFGCVNKAVGGTRGWRLPSVVELASVMDPSLPAVFNLQKGIYWSASSDAEFPTSTNKYALDFDNGTDPNVANQVVTSTKGNGNKVWCVRGPMSESVY